MRFLVHMVHGKEADLITLLIVEDDIYTRRGLMTHLDMKYLGIDSILEAENGEKGIEIAQKNKINILLSDIKMPHVDGIRLAQTVRLLYPDCILIFLSGYSDKEYLRSALSLRTFRYIDKPVNLPLLNSTLQEAVSLCKRMSISYSYSNTELRKKTARLLSDRSASRETISQQLELLKMKEKDFTLGRTVVIQLLNNSITNASSDFTPIMYACLSACEEFWAEQNICFLCSEFREQYILIHLLSSTPSEAAIISNPSMHLLLTELSAQLKDKPHFIALGSPVSAVWELSSSYQSAVLNLQHNFYFGVNTISGIDPVSEDEYVLDEKLSLNFRTAVIAHDLPLCTEYLEAIYHQFKTHPNTLISITRASYYSLVYWLFRYSSKKVTDIAFSNETFLFDKVNCSTTLDSLHAFVMDYLLTVLELTDQPREESVASMVQRIVNAECANPDLDIQFLCNRLNLSASHLSFLFKQSQHKTIIQYIQEIRIGVAKSLLITTDLRISEVAKQCGYPDPNYFTKVFHKYTTMLPSEYRELNRV